jgi:uncharacterized repeat protein (TIGR01451 family)
LIHITDKRIVSVGEPFDLNLTLTNHGLAYMSMVTIATPLPPNVTLAAPIGFANYFWSMYPGMSRTNTISLVANAPGTYRIATQIISASNPDPDSSPNTGTSDGEDDMTIVDIRTREGGGNMFVSPNPNPRVLPAAVSNQPPPLPNEAGLSLRLTASTLTPINDEALSLLVIVANRGALAATNVVVQLTIPTGWRITNPTGLIINGQKATIVLSNVPVGQEATINVPVQASNGGDQTIRAVIVGATQFDSDSAHTNGFGQGEDDEATVSVRVR